MYAAIDQHPEWRAVGLVVAQKMAVADALTVVADDDATAHAYATAANSPYRYYYTQLLTKLKRSGRAEVFKTSREQPDAELTVDSVCDSVVIAGSPNKVVDEILAFREQVGEFGTLLYAGKDWLDRERGRRSMILMAEKVLPAVNAAIGA